MGTKRAKHTPGPWTVERHDADRADIMFGEDGASVVVNMDRSRDGSMEYRARTLADAGLIAAAPDMRAALIALVRRYGTSGPGKLFKFPADHPIQIARAALAKAEGK